MGQWLTIILIVAIGVLLIAPNLFGAGLGRLVADLWVTVMGAVAGLIGGVFGA